MPHQLEGSGFVLSPKERRARNRQAMVDSIIAAARDESLRIDRKGLFYALFLGFTQFCVNF